MSGIHSIGGYTLAAGLFFLGLNGWWVLAAMAVATFVVMGLMNLTGNAGSASGCLIPCCRTRKPRRPPPSEPRG